MSEQAQCPNCGGYKVDNLKIYFIDKKSGETIRNGVIPSLLGLLTIFVCLPMLYPRGVQGNLIVFGVFLFLALILVIIAVKDIDKFRKTDKANAEDFACQLCGYKWSERSDEPKPLVTVRPDLIAKGAQKLKEEEKRRQEEERRRRQEDE